jgi:hypothetical protein
MSSKRKIALYLVGTFGVSWTIAFTYLALGGAIDTPAAQAVAFLFITPPFLAALAVKGAIAKEAVLDTLGLRLRVNRWLFLGWVLPVVAFLLATALAAGLPGAQLDLSIEGFLDHFRGRSQGFAEFEAEVRAFTEETGLHPIFRVAMQAMVAGVTINAVRALSEELGWRGFLRSELSLDFLREATIVGVIWGIWYAPLVAQGLWYRDAGIAGVPMGIAWCVAASAVLLHIRIKSGTIYAPSIFYGTYEALSRLPPLVRGPSELWVGLHGFAGIVALGALFTALVFVDRRGARA